eukprot:scaffold1487_cov116-Isochrysis_galbana.AAC.30
MSKSRLLNYFKHVPDDLVVTSTTGVIVSIVGTFILVVLFMFELHAYLSVTTVTDLVVDELADETLRVNFNVTLHAVRRATARRSGGRALPLLRRPIPPSRAAGPLRVPVRGRVRHDGPNLAQHQQGHPQVAARRAAANAARHVGVCGSRAPSRARLGAGEPGGGPGRGGGGGATGRQPVAAALGRHVRPLHAAARAHARQLLRAVVHLVPKVDCVAHQDFCVKQLIRAYPTLRMYKNGKDDEFELFTGERKVSSPRPRHYHHHDLHHLRLRRRQSRHRPPPPPPSS